MVRMRSFKTSVKDTGTSRLLGGTCLIHAVLTLDAFSRQFSLRLHHTVLLWHSCELCPAGNSVPEAQAVNHISQC
jgi:hypothetical protein